MKKSPQYNVLILHLDLGIGGAEQLIVTMAKCIQDLGHKVEILTSHHNVNHCFEETKPNGVLGKSISVYGDWLPRNFMNKFTAFFAILRMLLLAFIAIFFRRNIDLVILDGISAPIPLLKFAGFRVLFYCHFPDLLLCTDRSSSLKRFYRFFLDTFEKVTTNQADKILVNSEFTSSIFKEVFPTIYQRLTPSILYPVVPKLAQIDFPLYRRNYLKYLEGYDSVFVSVNRYERKKKIEIAIQAFHLLLKKQKKSQNQPSLLVIAGGYDKRVDENVEYLNELQSLCTKLGLSFKYIANPGEEEESKLSKLGIQVIFRTSIPTDERNTLFQYCNALLYTPDREHFGIVPVEAMSAGLPVIAVNSGGPTESVKHKKTGFLCQQTPEDFAEKMILLEDPELRRSMKQDAMNWVEEMFSITAMKEQLSKYIDEVVREI